MDSATIMRILERQGAPNTPDNVNRITQAAASDPSILEHYSMGTAKPQMQNGYDIRGGGGAEDNSALLKLAIDKSMGMNAPEQAPPPQALQAPAPAPVAQAPRPAPRPTGTPMDMNSPNLGPLPARDASPGEAGAPQGDMPSWLLPIIASLGPVAKYLGDRGMSNVRGSAPVTGAAPVEAPAPAARPARAVPRAIDNEGRAPAPYPTDIRRPNVQAPVAGSPAVPLSEPERSSPAGKPSGQSQADIDLLKQGVAGENASVAAKEAQDAKVLQDQMRTRELGNAAKDSQRLKNVGRAVKGR